MKQTYFTGVKELFPGSNVIRNFSFKAAKIRDSWALLSVANRQTAHFVIIREGSAHFRKQSCFECLSPHKVEYIETMRSA